MKTVSNTSKRATSQWSAILMGMVGLLFMVAYYYLVMSSPLLVYLKPSLTKSDIISAAESFYQKLSVSHFPAVRRVKANINEEVLAYAQYYRKNENKFPHLNLTPCYWIIHWTIFPGKQSSRSGGYFEVKYDFNGNMLGFKKDISNRIRRAVDETYVKQSAEDALFEAKYFLGDFGINPDILVLSNQQAIKKMGGTLYKFVFETQSATYRGLVKRYTVELFGSQVVTYQLNRVLDKTLAQTLTSKKSHSIHAISGFIIWTIIVLALIIRFIRKLQKDQLEFKRGAWIGAVLGLITLILMIGIGIAKGELGIIIGGGFLGGLTFLSFILLIPTLESQGRTVWPEKLKVMDLVFSGRFLIRETGVALLKACFMVGLSLLMVGATLHFSDRLKLGYISFSHDMVEFMSSPLEGLLGFSAMAILYTVLAFSLFNFWPFFLKEKIKNKPLWFLLVTLSFLMGGMQFLFFSPFYLSYLLLLPLALLFAFIVYRYDLLTVILAIVSARVLLDLILVGLVPGSLFGIIGILVIGMAAVFFLFGVYLVFRPDSAENYDNYIPEYVTRIAEKERLLRELEIARSVQMRFLPQKDPDLPALDIVSLCQPAMEVGGDYYDFIRIDERYMSVLIGDVSGKGVSAAFYMTMVKGIIKTLARRTRQPAELLAEANEIFYENAPRDVFITVIYGVFDLKEMTLTVASAGHNPLIVFKHKEGTTDMINPRGIAIGLDEGKRYRELIEEKTISIEEEDIFVFYTDGVSESMNETQEIYGENRLCRTIENAAHLPPISIKQMVIESVAQFTGKAAQHDDFTMIVVKVSKSRQNLRENRA